MTSIKTSTSRAFRLVITMGSRMEVLQHGEEGEAKAS
jgi:hypothetical protein